VFNVSMAFGELSIVFNRLALYRRTAANVVQIIQLNAPTFAMIWMNIIAVKKPLNSRSRQQHQSKIWSINCSVTVMKLKKVSHQHPQKGHCHHHRRLNHWSPVKSPFVMSRHRSVSLRLHTATAVHASVADRQGWQARNATWVV